MDFREFLCYVVGCIGLSKAQPQSYTRTPQEPETGVELRPWWRRIFGE
jgi:hypothetical protein